MLNIETKLKMSLMRVALFGALGAAAFAFSMPDAKAFQCLDVFRVAPAERPEIARALVDIGLENFTYVTKWQVKDPAQAGPYATRGELMVSGVPSAKFAEWMENVGSKSIGLMVSGLPESSPGTGYLRVGRKLYDFGDIQDGRPSEDFLSQKKTEATFMVSPTEMRAIEEFIRARGASEIVAQFDIRRGPKRGEPIRPDFDAEKFTLTMESCAAACSSFIDPKWLEHYPGTTGETLRMLAQRLNITPTYVAKQLIWVNARNPHTTAVTLFGIDRQAQPANPRFGWRERVDLMSNFIRDNHWGLLRGLPVYGLIPDPKSGNTGTISSERVPVREWLRNQRN